MLVSMQGNGKSHVLLMGMQFSTATVENSLGIPLKTTDLQHDPEIPVVGIYPQEMKILYQRKHLNSNFITAPFTIAKKWNQLKCPLTEELIKKCSIYIYIYTMKYYSVRKKNEILSSAANWMALQDVMLSEVR